MGEQGGRGSQQTYKMQGKKTRITSTEESSLSTMLKKQNRKGVLTN